MTRTPSDAARVLEAVEAAKEFLRLRSQIDSDKPMDVKALQKWQRHSFLKGDLICNALLSLFSRLETAREEMKEECKSAALSRRFGPPSGWAMESRPERWHLERDCTPSDAAMHDNGCIEAAQAIMALRSLSVK